MSENWLPSLKTDTPQAGFELAVKLSRMAVKITQPSDEVRTRLRTAYEQDSEQLIATSHVVAVHFQTVAAANNWWRWMRRGHRACSATAHTALRNACSRSRFAQPRHEQVRR